MISLTCGIFKDDTNELIYKTEIDSQTENKLMVNNKDLLYSTGNYTQYLIIGISLVVQWLRIRLPMQETQV